MSNILLIKTHALGDVLLTTPAIRAIYKSDPANKIYYLTCKWSSEALYHNPYLTEVFTLDDDTFFGKRYYKLIPFLIKIRKYNFDTILTFSSSKLIHFLAWLIGAPNRIGFGYSCFLTHKIDPSVLQKYYAAKAYNALLEPLFIPEEGLNLDFYTKKIRLSDTLINFKKKFKNNLVGLFCGGGKNPRDTVMAKQWRINNFIALAKKLHADGYGFLLFGSKDDYPSNNIIQNELNDIVFNLSGFYSLNETGYLMKLCKLFVTNDSAPFHISYSLNIPSLCVFGPSNSKLLSPQLTFCKSIQSNCVCSPCYGNEIFSGCQNPICMDTITVDIVYKECKRILDNITTV